VTSSWFFLSTLNYDARSATHQNNRQSFNTNCCTRWGAGDMLYNLTVNSVVRLNTELQNTELQIFSKSEKNW